MPNFIPDETPIRYLTAWVHIPNLSVEYFDVEFLKKVGSRIGKILRIDKTTESAERGQFTRLSVWSLIYLNHYCLSSGCEGKFGKSNLKAYA